MPIITGITTYPERIRLHFTEYGVQDSEVDFTPREAFSLAMGLLNALSVYLPFKLCPPLKINRFLLSPEDGEIVP